ncbi:MAG TPA: hypothetical protein VL346_07990, partial [Acidobacteriaceae bacterium]|nr:hypothetical protein [Acidobacteriaceae bacterium]
MIQNLPGALLAGKAQEGKSVSGASELAVNHSSAPLHDSVSTAGDSDQSSAGKDAKSAGQPAAQLAHSPKEITQKGDIGSVSATAHPGGPAERQPVVLKSSAVAHGVTTGGDNGGFTIHVGA